MSRHLVFLSMLRIISVCLGYLRAEVEEQSPTVDGPQLPSLDVIHCTSTEDQQFDGLSATYTWDVL